MAERDPLLAPLFEAPDAAARDEALEAIVARVAPLIDRILARYRHADGALQKQDADDIASAVTLRLLRRLRAGEELEAIERLEDYVARQIHHAVYDVLRRRFPERTRLKNRLRYLLRHDARLTLWPSPAGLAAGLVRFRGETPPSAEPQLTGGLARSSHPVEALHDVLARAGGPVAFEQLVRFFAALWNVVDVRPDEAESTVSEEARQLVRLESREDLEMLWSEIRELRPPQRAALLLNARDDEGTSISIQFVLLGITTIDELARTLELSPERLAALWATLPMDDLATGAMLGVTRQQVINLRKAARARLARRMTMHGARRRS